MGTYRLFEAQNPAALEKLIDTFLGDRNGAPGSVEIDSQGEYRTAVIRFDSQNGEHPINVKQLFSNGPPGDEGTIEINSAGVLYFRSHQPVSSIADYLSVSPCDVVHHIIKYHQEFHEEESLPNIEYATFTPQEVGAVAEYFLQQKQTLESIAEQTTINLAVIRVCAVGHFYRKGNMDEVAKLVHIGSEEVRKCAIAYRFMEMSSNDRKRAEKIGKEFGLEPAEAEKEAVVYLGQNGLSGREMISLIGLGSRKISDIRKGAGI
ncbi:hypothetical protein COV17_03410 [Candidatus Woesearchaeota archaeon CG10_big_fil_rev_8_21_14_0_10_36_11]|nr:MAG: hypothetical protein COV17_03410 [Candidatus Woesearchaeota archaeon CG10_big_fil_rev_8_21_14_0_10_36_11]